MISVDQWSSGSQIYFLTHLHADHTVGLSPRWNKGPVYCSRITARLFHPKFPGFDLSLLRVIEIGRWYSLSLVLPSTGMETKVQVMAIDANHCPGAFMYLFRGEFGIMLYTGDFRWEVTSEIAQMGKTMLLNALKNDKIDTLYIDNTYCNPSYSFPSREVAAQQVVNIINSYPEHDIIIGIDSLGKEDLLLYISKMLKIKIWVWPERLQIMHLLGLHANFTTKTTLTRVRAVPRYSFSVETLEGLNSMRPTIGILPSGLPWALKKAGCKDKSCDLSSMKTETNIDLHMNIRNRYTNNIEKHHQYIYTVPYSDHSCFPEILEFVKFLCPSNIKGIVSSSSSYVDPRYHLRNIIGASSLCQKSVTEEERERVEADTISANRSLAGDQTITSKHDNFVLGFFKAGNTSNYYVGIWYKKVASNPPSVVWVANREIPVSDRVNSELKIVDGNLVLLNKFKLQIWSTNVTTTNTNSVIAVIHDDGNLVLTDGSNSAEPVWQSFDHPVNTWLPGAKLAYDYRRKKKQLLTSWKSEENPDVLFSPLCGAFSTSRETQMLICDCLTGFKPRSESGWNQSDFSGGCVRKTELQCGRNEENSNFIMINVTYLPSNNFVAAESAGECHTTCMNNCSCNAYSFAYNECSLWDGELLDLSVDNDFNGKTVYVKVASKDLPTYRKKHGFPVGPVSGSFVEIC
ncbi:DNA repair metallo-beta-lactamase family protein [Artemisia annua]|uniref:Protein artemis n=1 Tax=Artemisia annua TaxID=35608 RepID=A0A2U1KLB8_ARTAN|nr:DNA repair metallo-beta-lactamase family protein [Artemisia annua]